MNTNETQSAEHIAYLKRELVWLEQQFAIVNDERRRLENLNYSTIIGLKSICRHRPSALRQIDAIQGEITDVYYEKAYGETPCLMVHYRSPDFCDDKIVRVRLED